MDSLDLFYSLDSLDLHYILERVLEERGLSDDVALDIARDISGKRYSNLDNIPEDCMEQVITSLTGVRPDRFKSLQQNLYFGFDCL